MTETTAGQAQVLPVRNRWVRLAVLNSICLISMMSFHPQAAVARNCVVEDNLDEIADSFISRCKKASIRREFPSELLGKTLGEIFSGSAWNYKKAQKLLKRRIYDKSATAPEVLFTGRKDGLSGWSVAIDMDLTYPESLRFGFGDGDYARLSVPRGSGSKSFEITRKVTCAPGSLKQVAFIEGGVVGFQPLPDGDMREILTSNAC